MDSKEIVKQEDEFDSDIDLDESDSEMELSESDSEMELSQSDSEMELSQSDSEMEEDESDNILDDMSNSDEEHNIHMDFLHACKNNDTGAVLKLLRRGIDVNLYESREWYSGLHYACRYECEETVRILLDQPLINLNIQNFEGETPLYIAAESNQSPAIIKLLTEANCDVNIKTMDDETVIYPIIVNNCNFKTKIEMAKLILEKGFVFSQKNSLILLMNILNTHDRVEDGNDSLESYLNFAKLFLDYNIHINFPHKSGPSAMYESFYKKLLRRNIPEELDIFFDHMDNSHFTHSTFYTAIVINSPYVYKMIDRGFDINYATRHSNYLLMSLKSKDTDLFKYLWNNCDKEKIFEKHHFELLSNCFRESLWSRFTKENFLEMIYLILESQYAAKMVKKAVKNYLYYFFVVMADKYELSQEERLKMIDKLLSYNQNITFDDLCHVYERYGFDKEFEAFIRAKVNIIGYADNAGLVSHIANPHLPFNYDNKPPSLQELSRDAFRANLKYQGRNFQHCNNIRSMTDIPKVIQDILVLKKNNF